jgi:hypothetical protein
MGLNKYKYISIVPLLFALSCGDSSSKKFPGSQPNPPSKAGGTTGNPQLTANIQVESFETPDKGFDYGSELVLQWKSNREGKCSIKMSSNQAALYKADSLPATGQLTISAEEATSLVEKQSHLSLQLDCKAEGVTSSKWLNIPVSRFDGFKVNNEVPKTGEKVYLSWTSENLRGPCKINGQQAIINPFEVLVEESPKTIKNFVISCPGFKRTYEASVKIFVMPDNRLAWYLASDFTLNSKLIDSEIEKTHEVIGHDPVYLSWKTADEVNCIAREGFSDDSPEFEVKTEGGVSSIVIENPKRTLVKIECRAPEGRYPSESSHFYIRMDRKSVWAAGAISITSMLLDDKSEDSLKSQRIFANDKFRLYANIDNIKLSSCQIGFEGEPGSELLSKYPVITNFSKAVYQKPEGKHMAWVECKLDEGTYRRNFPVDIVSADSQRCPENIIRIYDISQLSLPSACSHVPIVLMAVDSIAWEPFRASGKPIKLKLSADQTLKVDHHYDVVRYGQNNESVYRLGDFIFTKDYLSNGENFEPLHLEIEGDASKRISRLVFELVKASKVTVRNVEAVENDLLFLSGERSEFNFVDLESAGRLLAAGSRKVRVNAPMLKKLTGGSLGDVNTDDRRSRPGIGGFHAYSNMSLLIQARLESVTGEFAVEGNDGEVSLVPPGMTAVGLIQQPLKEVLKSSIEADSGRIRQRLNGALLIAGNEVLQKVDLPQLSKVEGGGVIGKFTNLGIVTLLSEGEEKVRFSENGRLLELNLAKPGPGAHEIKLLPEGSTLDFGELDPETGFGNALHIVRDPQLVDFKVGQ